MHKLESAARYINSHTVDGKEYTISFRLYENTTKTICWVSGSPQPWNAPYGAPPAGDEERPPPGCDRDAIKLFLSGVPKNWEVPELKQALEEFGTVRPPSTTFLNLIRSSCIYTHIPDWQICLNWSLSGDDYFKCEHLQMLPCISSPLQPLVIIPDLASIMSDNNESLPCCCSGCGVQSGEGQGDQGAQGCCICLVEEPLPGAHFSQFSHMQFRAMGLGPILLQMLRLRLLGVASKIVKTLGPRKVNPDDCDVKLCKITVYSSVLDGERMS